MHETHWNDFYGDRSTTELAWHEPVPSTLGLVTRHTSSDASVIDVGGGASMLAGDLLAAGYRDVTVLDLSQVALDRARDRLGARADDVTWIHTDVCTFRPQRTWDAWHDRAAFHFLTDPADRLAYRSVATRAVRPGGILIVSTFSPDGPERCALLPVCRYDAPSLAAEFADGFERIADAALTPTSPEGDQRPYTAVVLRRTTT